MEGLNKEHLEEELRPFLNPEAILDVKGKAIEYFLGLSGDSDGCAFVGSSDKFLEGIVSLLNDDHKDIVEKAYKTLINLTILESTSERLLDLPSHPTLTSHFVKEILDPDFKMADFVCQLLSNVTRNMNCAQKVAKVLLDNDQDIHNLVKALCILKHNPDANLHYLATVLGNLTQIKEVRSKVMARDQYVVQRLLPFIEFKSSAIRRHGIASCLKNCCFDEDNHDWLVSDQVDLLPRLLLPLAGPEELDDDDNEKLPDELQYLPPDKEREPDPDIRKILLEAIYKLCTTQKVRLFVKDKNTYVIIREFYNWEKHEPNFKAVTDLMQILIGDEPEEGKGDLHKVEVPTDIEEKFKKYDEENPM